MSNLNVATMLLNISHDIPQLMRMVTAIGYITGMWLIVSAVLGLRLITNKSDGAPKLNSLIIKFGVGTALLYLPSAMSTGYATFFGDYSPLSYIPRGESDFALIKQAALLVISFVGTIAFIRGMLLLNHLEKDSANTAKAIAYIVSGVLCVNLEIFLAIVGASLGVTFAL